MGWFESWVIYVKGSIVSGAIGLAFALVLLGVCYLIADG